MDSKSRPKTAIVIGMIVVIIVALLSPCLEQLTDPAMRQQVPELEASPRPLDWPRPASR